MRRSILVIASCALMGLATGNLAAQETTVQNDSLMAGQNGNIQAGFAAGESAAVWLTSPCDGNIVAVQVFWRSFTGGEPQSIEDSISVFGPGSFPTPGALLQTEFGQPAEIVGPVMTDGVINEFRFLDENQTQPLSVPISMNDGFVVSFQFMNNVPALGPSVVTDTSGCQNGKNAIFAIPGGWLNACALGVTGDFVIRAVVECNPTQACCFDSDSCVNLAPDDCTIARGVPQGPGTDCGSVVCFPTGACCLSDGECVDDLSSGDCSAMDGTYQGDGTVCTPSTCPAPSGACCLSNGNCLFLDEEDCNGIPNASWAGGGTDCTDADMSGTADDCEAGFCGDGTVNGDEDCEESTDCAPGEACVDCACVPAGIPTVSEFGVIIMALLLLTIGSIVFQRRTICLTG